MNEEIAQNTRILTARKGYEYRLDDLRLTMLCTPPLVQRIKDAFHFQVASITTPPEIFGPVQVTLPAGLAFQLGMWPMNEEQIVPIRFLHIEPQRVVIDVGGPSSAVDGIYARLHEIVDGITAPDNGPVLGEPERILTFSEISFPSSGALKMLLKPNVQALLTDTARQAEHNQEVELLSILQFRGQPASDTFHGEMNPSDGHTFTLSLRAGTGLNSQTYYSGAPLDTDAHLAYLNALTAALSD